MVRRSGGRPRKRETHLSRWLDAHNVGRDYLDQTIRLAVVVNMLAACSSAA